MPELTKPLLLYDGDCHFCRLWVERWRRATGDAVEYAPFQQRGAEFPAVPRDAFERSVVFVDTDGSVYEGAEAVLLALSSRKLGRALLYCYRRVPGVAAASQRLYFLVASNRQTASRFTRLLWGDHLGPSEYRTVARMLLLGIAAVYLMAFASLWTQAEGLFGSAGILPVAELLENARTQLGLERYRFFPTLFWLNSSDFGLHVACAVGVSVSAVLMFGRMRRVATIALWILYLSLFSVGGVFLSFQWDVLLLETGFLAILLAGCGANRNGDSHRTVIFLLRFLLFRLMFSSGMVKLLSNDPSWWNLQALHYHYFTQPLPPWTAWYVARLPLWFHQASAGLMFTIELVVPFFVFAPRRLRNLAAFAFVLLMTAIIVTGNYGIFNVLTIVLCVSLFDDASLRRLVPRSLASRKYPERRDLSHETRRIASPGWRRPVAAGFAVLMITLGLVHMTGRFCGYATLPAPIRTLVHYLGPFHLSNSYGLFAAMTKTRPEIVIEGSKDGREWLAYEFKWKPGDTSRRPAFVAPHQPRLDWQMWFAALGDYRGNPWILRFMQRLLEGSPAVLALLDKDPFAGERPRYLRALRYDYRFSDPDSRRSGEGWWVREKKGLYVPVLTSRR